MPARALLIALAVVTLQGAASTSGAPSSLDERLPNGMRVVLIPHHANPMVASAVVVGAGVVQESDVASGASHFLEHLLFNGTTTRTQRQLYDDVDRLGAYNNATTREDHTLFTLLVARELAEAGLAIQADMLFRSTIPEANFDKERKIVLEELARDRSDPSYDVEAAFRAWAYAGTPIARPVLGTEGTLGAVSRADVVAYYKSRYVPSNMTLVVMGDFEIASMREVVKRTFGGVPKGPRPPDPAGTWPKPPAENLVTAPSGGPAVLHAGFPIALDPADRAAAAVEVLLSAASEGEDAPLQRALARRGVKADAATLALELRLRPWSTVAAQATVAEGTDPRLVLEAVAEALAETGPGGSARSRVPRVLAAERADAAIARDQIHYYVLLRSSTMTGAPPGSIADASARFADLGESDWDAASTLLLSASAGLRARFTGPGVAEGRSSWRPAPATAREARSTVRSGALPNGLRYVVRTTNDSDVFAVHVITAPRAAAEPAGFDGITDLLHRMMTRGTIVRDEAALEDILARIGGRLKTFDDPSVPFDDYYTTPEFAWMRMEVPGDQWRVGLGLVGEILRLPAIRQESLEEARRQMRDLAARNTASPRSVASAKLDALLAPGQPLIRPVLGTPATLDTMTLEALRSYHAASATGRRTIVSIVGSVDADEVVHALESDFGVMPAGDAVAAGPPVAPNEPSEPTEIVVGKPQAYVAMGEILEVAPEDRAALAVAVAMLSDRLSFDLRETQGLAYSVGAQLRPWGGRMRLDLTMGTRPENLEAARRGLLAGARDFRAAAPGAADVERTINKLRGAALMRRMTRISLAYEAGLEALRGQEPGDERRFVDSLQAVTPADVSRAASKYIDAERFAQVIVR